MKNIFAILKSWFEDRKRRTREKSFIRARAQLRFPYTPDHVTEEQIRQAVAKLAT